MSLLRRRPFAYSPPSAEVLSSAELAWVREIQRVARYWLLEPGEIENLLFTRWLIDAGRLGRGDS